jgi:hypothetical protein
MSIFDYQNPIISQMRTNYIDKSESHQIVNSKVVLSELPDSFAKVNVSGIGVTWIETKNPSPSANEYYVDYTNGVVTHHSSREGIQLLYSFKAKGLQFYPASRVYVETDSNGDVVKTLGDIISQGEQAIIDLGLVSEAIDDAETATQAAINATNTVNSTNTNIQSSESGRVTAENTRNSQESTRQSQETTRKNQETSRVSAETSRVGAENARVTAESNRITTETIRENAESSRASAETARASAESSRVTAESGRASAESSRATEESNRASAETTRAGNETTRQNNESARVTAENNRVSVESARVNAENSRASAEASRVSVESARVIAENSRVTNENARSTAETARSTSETARQTNETTRQSQESTRQTNTTNAISNLNTAINTTKLNYKTPVATFADIATTYPSPQLGDAVQVLADNKYYRYDGSTWKHFNTFNLTGAASSADVDVVAQASAELIRQQVHSGITNLNSGFQGFSSGSLPVDGALQVVPSNFFSVYPNNLMINPFNAFINGNKLLVKSANAEMGAHEWNRALLPEPPTYGTRDDLVLLEAWFPQVGQKGVMQWRIRTVAGVDFEKYRDGIEAPIPNPSVQAQGGNSAPLNNTPIWSGSDDFFKHSAFFNEATRSYYSINGYSSAKGIALGDKGLWVAGYGDQTSKDTLKTIDGYVYAIPLFRVKRRNSGGYRADNVNGARDYVETAVTGATTPFTINTPFDLPVISTAGFNTGDKIYVIGKDYPAVVNQVKSSTVMNITVTGNSSGVFWGTQKVWLQSDRPDGLYSNIINANDIIDLRHKVSLTGVNYQSLLEVSMDSLLRGTLTTKDTKTTVNETYGLQRAPIGVPQDLQSVHVKRADGTSVDLKNLLGMDGGFETLIGWNFSGVSPVLSTAYKRSGLSSLKVSATPSLNSYIHKDYAFKLETSKQYLVLGWVYIESYASGIIEISIRDHGTFDSRYSTNANTSQIGSWQLLQIKISTSNTVTTNGFRLLVGSGGTGVMTAYFDEVSIYEITAADYAAIDTMTNAQIAAKWPYVDSLPNIAENLIDYTKIEASPYATPTLIQNGVSLTGDYYVRYPISLPAGITLSANWDSKTISGSPTNLWTVLYSDATNAASVGRGASITTTKRVSEIYLYVASGISASAEFTNIRLQKTSDLGLNIYVPYGRWFIPANYQGYNSHLGNNSLIHYDGVNGTQFHSNRSVFSDAITVEKRSNIVEALKTSQGHIKVTQATEGVWAIGDTIKIRNEYGVITGVADSDTAVVKILQWVDPATVIVDDVSKLEVNDAVSFVKNDLSIIAAVVITAINAPLNRVTTNGSIGADIVDYFIVETTASSSAPTVTAAGIAGTWTGLGTKEVTYTITTAPTVTTTNIKIDYSAVFPPGKGINNVATNVLDAYVNGQRTVTGTTASVKANFVGKASGSTDVSPHVFKGNFQSTIQVPSSVAWTERGTSEYATISSLNGATSSVLHSLNGEIAQQLFSFDLIRLMEDKYGERFFADCLDTAAKVAKLKTLINKIEGKWWGFGSSSGGNIASLVGWNSTDGIWHDWVPWGSQHTSSTPTLRSIVYESTNPTPMFRPNYNITSDGFVHYLVCAEASNGTTATSISTDYVELEVSLNTAETGYTVLQPENPFPVLSENILVQNQAFPIDLSWWNVAYGIAMGLDNERGTLAISNFPSSGYGYAYFAVSFPREGTYTLSMEVFIPSSSTATYAAISDDGNFLFATVTNLKAYDVTKKGTWQTVSATYTLFSTLSLSGLLGLQVVNTTGALDVIKIRKIKLQQGPIATTWTPGRKSLTVLNYLGKSVGNTFDNPHRALYTTSSSTSIVPSTFTAEHTQTVYDSLGKQDGGIYALTATATGQHAIALYEFDLSHLGMSLSQLKAAVRGLTFKWVGYGIGDSGGVLSYGATAQVWDDVNQGWVGGVGGWVSTSSAPSLIANGIATSWPTSNFITENQKIYVAVYSTNPASASFSSQLFTDYASFQIAFADYVDYVKGNIVKIRPETKETKLQFPARSYRNLGGGANSDVVSLNYQYMPYQGTAKELGFPAGLPGNYKFLTDAIIVATTEGSGNLDSFYRDPLSLGQSVRCIINRMPLHVRDYEYNISGNVTYEELTGKTLVINPVAVRVGNTIGKFFVMGSDVHPNETPNTSPPYRGAWSGDGWSLGKDIKAFDAGSKILITTRLMLHVATGEVFLRVNTAESLMYALSGATDMFRLPGRPLLKGV